MQPIEQLKSRLESLKKEFEIGQTRLKELEKEENYIRETMLRISGAIQVLKEILEEAQPDRSLEAAAGAGN